MKKFVGDSLLFALVLFANLWIWKVFYLSLVVGALLILSSFFLYQTIKKNPKENSYIFILLFVFLLYFQLGTTQKIPLTYLDNDEQRIQQMRLSEYPLFFLKIGNIQTWIPIAYWFEGRRETIALFRIQKNFSEAIDANLYFFANHPRERVGFDESEKFPYIFLPFFILGAISLMSKTNKLIWLASLFVPLFLISFVGQKNVFGPLSIFPFVVVTTTQGIERIFKTFPRLILFGGFVILFLVLIQMAAYERY